MEQKPLQRMLVVGAGGHAKVVIEVARSAGWLPIAAFDPGSELEILGVPVRGSDDHIASFWAQGGADSAVIAVGDNRLRQHLANKVREIGCPTPAIIHPGAWISPTARVAEGVVVMAGAVVNADAVIGRDCIVNTMAVVEHDCVLGEAVHVAPRSAMGGKCQIGTGTLFGIGAIARPDITIGAYAVVGAGAVLVSNIAESAVVAGNPARLLGA